MPPMLLTTPPSHRGNASYPPRCRPDSASNSIGRGGEGGEKEGEGRGKWDRVTRKRVKETPVYCGLVFVALYHCRNQRMPNASCSRQKRRAEI